MDEEYYRQIVERYLSNKCTDEELAVFVHLMSEGKLDSFLIEAIRDEETDVAEKAYLTKPAEKGRSFFRGWIRSAAAVLVIITFSLTIFHYRDRPGNKLVETKMLTNDVMPGSNKAILALANGEKITLDEVANGNISSDGNTHIIKPEEGKLIFNNTSVYPSSGEHPLTLNTLSTPKGGQYQLKLPDGTKAWINASSSVTFPTEFAANERKIKITGEVYLEVAKNPKKPFIVETEQQSITVLGTHFNVSAYPDEQETKTTLLEGSVKVISKYGSKLLSPGQQSVLSSNGLVVQQTNVQSAVAWKEGNFSFDHTDLPVLLRQLSRWYDVDIVYVDHIGKHEFVGEFSRNLKLSSVLKILESSGVHFKISNKKLLIQP